LSISSDQSVIIEARNVWKIYCRQLKRAMWYGLRDLTTELSGQGHDRPIGELRRGEFYAIKDASFQVRRGECVAMMGPNGAGKSTMLKMINGLIRPNSGSIAIRGRIGALIELGTGFNPTLTGRENVYVNASILGLKKQEVDRIFDDIVDFAELGHVINDPVKTYSSGMKVRLGFSVAANLRPDLLIMDEILAVGDVGFRMKCFAHLKNLIASGVAIILVSHAISMLQRVATRAIVFGQGEIVHDGDLQTAGSIYEELVSVVREDENGNDQDEPVRNMDASITGVSLLDDSSREASEFETGDSLQVEVTIEAKSKIQSARLIVALASPTHGVMSAVSTAYQNIELNLAPGTTKITLRIDTLPLLIGSFHFNVSLYGPETIDFYHRVVGQAPFRIVGPPINTDGRGIRGMIRIEHDWTVS
jgi:lipopolysaccharide transport system ATP-binding protein